MYLLNKIICISCQNEGFYLDTLIQEDNIIKLSCKCNHCDNEYIFTAKANEQKIVHRVIQH